MKTHALVNTLSFSVVGIDELSVMLFSSESEAVAYAVEILVRSKQICENDGVLYDDDGLQIQACDALEYFQNNLTSSEYFHVMPIIPVAACVQDSPVVAKEDVPVVVTEDANLNSDCTASEARALHRVVRAMHDGNCPKCGYLGTATEFEYNYARAPRNLAILDHICPACKFCVRYKEAEAAMEQFRPFMEQNVELFEAWRKRRQA